MKNRGNKGFLLVESLIMFVLLSVFFFHVYRTAANYIQRERRNLFHDDIASLYQGHYMKEVMLQFTNLSTWTVNPTALSDFIDAPNRNVAANQRYGRVMGAQSGVFLLHPDFAESYEKVTQRLNLHQVFITNDVRSLRTCARTSDWMHSSVSARCHRTFMDEELRSFISSIDVGEITNNRAIIFTFRRSETGGVCREGDCFSHFTWVAI